MKWILSTLLLAAGFTIYNISFFNQPTGSEKSVDEMIDKLLENVPSLPRYMEGGYSPLGRSPVVDALLDDPLYAPLYAEFVAETIKKQSQISSLSRALYTASGIPNETLNLNIESKPIPEFFSAAFPSSISKILHQYWLSFMAIEKETNAILSALTEEEKTWIKINYNKFFFGEENGLKYEFFTNDSPYPFKFFELASKIDLAKLAACSIQLSKIADEFNKLKDVFLSITLDEDFIWKENNLTFIISQKSHSTHKENADFFIDLGGYNTIQNNAGGTEGKRSLALHLDLKGHNTYIGNNFTQGSGFLGVGLLYCCSGNNSFNADSYSQAAGFFGFGSLVSTEGNNRYILDFGGQSFALFGGSILLSKGGNNDYQANQGMAQAASSTLGVAFLIDKGGNSFTSGVSGSGGTTRFGGIGQGGSSGSRGHPWLNNPSLYGGLSYLFLGEGRNRLKTVWLGQGSAYFLSAGILVAEGANDTFEADYDAQGQGLHLAAGVLLKKGGENHFNGGWGSLGVAGDRSIGIFIGNGENNHFQGTDQSIGTSRKPKAFGLFVNFGKNNTYNFKKISNARIELPSSPLEWSYALFLDAGKDSKFSEHVDEFTRGNNLEWGIENHSLGLSTEEISQDAFYKKLHKSPPASFNPQGWMTNTAFKPLIISQNLEQELPQATLDRRRQIYETLDLMRFKDRKNDPDLSYLLQIPDQIDEDLLNYTILWSLRNKNKVDLGELKRALAENKLSPYSRKMATSLIGTFYTLDAVPLLSQLMTRDKTDAVRYFAALSLTFHLSPESLPLIKQNIHSDSEAVRYAIAKGLQENPNPDALSLAKEMFNDKSFYVRRAAGLSALSLGDKSGIPVILETLKYETLDTTYNYGDNIFAHMSNYLDVDFGVEKDAWIEWWDRVKDEYQLPKNKN